MKKILGRIAAGIAVCFLTAGSVAAPVYAAVDNGAVYPIESNSIDKWPQMGEIGSETAVLMEADTGEVLCNKGMYETRYPASITKIMTTLLALENSSLTDQVTFTEAALARMWEGTNIGSQVGEVLTMEQCLNVVMLVSANEVAAQVAIHIAGSEAEFVQMMNTRAQQLGCQHTNFNNASGLPDENHYTCAYDMALIFREALKNEDFRKIISERTCNLAATNKNPDARTYNTHLAMVAPDAPEYYKYCIGGKTGVTQVAKNTLVTAAEKDDHTLIAVVLRGDPAQVYADSKALYEYGFANFTKIKLHEGSVTVPKGIEVADLKSTKENRDGKVLDNYYLGDKYVGTATDVESDAESDEETGKEDIEVPELPQDNPENSNPMLEHKGFAAAAGAAGGIGVLGILLLFGKLFSRK